MEIKEYVDQKRHLYNLFMSFMEEVDDIDNKYKLLINEIEKLKISENPGELESFLRLIVVISNNYHREQQFYDKIKKILQYFEGSIKQSFLNTQLFDIIKESKLILLYFFKNKIISLDQNILDYIEFRRSYNCFFYPEIIHYIDEYSKNRIESVVSTIDSFEEKRQIGENETKLCKLIREDSLDEFIQYIHKNDISITNTTIQSSIFETHELLIPRNQTLIEYSAFFGSIKIFNYLKTNDVDLKPSLWIYAIHGKNSEIIYALQENNVSPPENSFEICLENAVKCHHNEIAEYIRMNFIDPKEEELNIRNKFEGNIVDYSIHYHNFAFFPEDLEIPSIIFYLIYYNYTEAVKYSTLQLAIHKGNHEIFNFLLTQGPPEIDNYLFHGSRITTVTIPSSIKTIGREAFSRCYNLSQIIFENPSSLIKIKEYAFLRCESIIKITLPPSLVSIEAWAFHECENLSEILISSSVKSIGDFAFYNCTSLKNVSFENPSSLELIGQNAFDYCISLVQISIPSSVLRIEKNAFMNCSNLSKLSFESPSSIYFIGNQAFRFCLELSEIQIPSSVKSIGGKVFSKFSKQKEISFENLSSIESFGEHFFCNYNFLTQITISSSTEIIKRKAFSKCKALKQVTFASPSFLKEIREYAFNECISLTEIELPSSVQSIAQHCFNKCSSLKKVKLPSNIYVLKKYIFNECESLEQILIPSSVKKIGMFAFNECKSLTKVTFEDQPSILSIRSYAFGDCSSLVDISLPSTLISIRNYVFLNCTSIKIIEIPSSVRKIGDGCFMGCSSLEKAVISPSIKKINIYTFKNCSSLKDALIPDSVSHIHPYAFNGCTSLEK